MGDGWDPGRGSLPEALPPGLRPGSEIHPSLPPHTPLPPLEAPAEEAEFPAPPSPLHSGGCAEVFQVGPSTSGLDGALRPQGASGLARVHLADMY